MIVSAIREFGIMWAFNRTIYSLKLKSINALPFTEGLYEKRVKYPSRIDIFDINGKALRNFICKYPYEIKKKIITRADNAISGKILGFSSIELDYGYPINWQLNPLTGKESKITKKWYQIPDFDSERGDIKVIWEVSRFSQFIIFARAYCITGDIKYYNAFKEQLIFWLRDNPYSYGANYKCGQECSMRMICALLAYAVFSSFINVDEEVIMALKELVYNTYRKVLSNFFYAYRCIKNDHTFSELMGMLICAWCCEDSERIEWANKVLNEIICEQFSRDGGYKSFSFNYEREIFQEIECLLSVKEKLGISLEEESVERLRKAVELVFQCQSEDGSVPNYGANDGTLLFQVTPCDFKDYRPVLNTIHALLTNEQIYGNGNHQEELIWFAGRKKEADFKRKVIERKSAQFSEAGLFTTRTMDAWSMMVLNSYKTRPAHMDQLHIDLWINDINVLCDTGTYSYADIEGKKLVDNAYHNTVRLKNVSQMKTHGAFLIYDRTIRGEYSFAIDSFSGTITSKNGYTHTRTINYSNKKIHIEDKVTGKKGTEYNILFHTPCDVEIKDNVITLSYRGKTLCEISSSNRFFLQKSERSLSYMKREEIFCICINGMIDNNSKISTDIKIIEGETENG